MTTGRPLRLGTRGSLLALAQSRLVVRALRAADPGLSVEIVTIETRGDRDRHTPLANVGDPDFFSAELDQALLAGRIDFSVHSLKDLPLNRPAKIHTAAIPLREDPRDVVVFRREVCDMLRAGEPLRIGSSSARRSLHAERFLHHALPVLSEAPPRLELSPLRGPVERRLQRLGRRRPDPEALDGVILALAGLARLWGDRDGHAAIAGALGNTRLMVLPLGECPAAPGQGALAIECRAGDEPTAATLAQLHDAATARRVRRELALLARQPEAQRPGFAATCVGHVNCGSLVFVRGVHAQPDCGSVVWRSPPRPAAARTWDGADWVHASRARPLPAPVVGEPKAVFLAHWRTLTAGLRLPGDARLWVSGVASWRRLARLGLWVEGCADNLGFGFIRPTLQSPALRLPALREWSVLTRADAVDSWRDSGVGEVIPTYAVSPPADAAALLRIRRQIGAATHFFWGSAAQFRAVREWLPEDSHHACGPGKTYRALREAGVENLQAFPSRKEWRAWVA